MMKALDKVFKWLFKETPQVQPKHKSRVETLAYIKQQRLKKQSVDKPTQK